MTAEAVAAGEKQAPAGVASTGRSDASNPWEVSSMQVEYACLTVRRSLRAAPQHPPGSLPTSVNSATCLTRFPVLSGCLDRQA